MSLTFIKRFVNKATGCWSSTFKIDSDGVAPCTLENNAGALKTATVEPTTLNLGATPIALTDNSGALAVDADVLELGTTPISITDNSGALAVDADVLELGTTPITLTDDSGDFKIDADALKLGSTVAQIKSDSGVLKVTNDGGAETPLLASKMVFSQQYVMSADISAVTLMEFTATHAGYLVGSSVKMSADRTDGSIAFKVQKNGVDLTPTGLSLDIDDDPTTKVNAAVAYGTADYDIAAGDVISIIATSTTFTPSTNNINLALVLEG